MQELLAFSKRDHSLAIVDPNSLKVIARAPVGPDPHEVIASDDCKTHTYPSTAAADIMCFPVRYLFHMRRQLRCSFNHNL
jgi:hypothetical protein